MALAPGRNANGYVIFKNPPDHPGKFVVKVRRMMGNDGVLDATPVAVAETLDAARAAIQNTDCLLCLPHGLQDDPHVVETWI